MGLSATEESFRIRVTAFNHNALYRDDQVLIFSAGDFRLKLHHLLPAPLLFFLRELIFHQGGGCSLLEGVLENSQAVKLRFLDKIQEFLKILRGLAGESDNE